MQSTVARCFAFGRTFAVVGHGVLELARARDSSGGSLLHGFHSTCLPNMERLAFSVTAWKLGRYYLTYPDYVETEVRAALAPCSDFQRGPITLFAKSTAESDRGGFVVEARHYLSGRWPGDVHLLARRFLTRLQQV